MKKHLLQKKEFSLIPILVIARRRLILSSIAALSLFGCASSKNLNDPYENYNRKVFAFNMAADKYVIRPVAVTYMSVPEPIRDVVTNFYNNLRDFVSLGNDILQLNGGDTMRNTMRIALNSTFGILGLIDISSSLGLPQSTTSFGDTLKRWGWKNSSYLVLPFLGPGTIRDDIGIAPDIYFNPLFWVITQPAISWSIFGVNLVDQRSSVLGQDKIVLSSIDPYATVRDIYLQRRGAYIYPTQDTDSNNSDNIDQIIDQENNINSATPKRHDLKPNRKKHKNTDIDKLIDEENQSATPSIHPIVSTSKYDQFQHKTNKKIKTNASSSN